VYWQRWSRTSTSLSAFTPSNQRVEFISRSPDLSAARPGSVGGGAEPKGGGGGGGAHRGGPPERQLTLMLVSVCVAFVCLRLPYTISYALYEYTKVAVLFTHVRKYCGGVSRVCTKEVIYSMLEQA